MLQITLVVQSKFSMKMSNIFHLETYIFWNKINNRSNLSMDILMASFLVKSPTKSVSKAYRWTFHSNPTAANMAAGVLNRARQRTGGSRWGGGLEVRWWKLWVLKMLDDMQKREGFMMISLETLEFLGLEGLDP